MTDMTPNKFTLYGKDRCLVSCTAMDFNLSISVLLVLILVGAPESHASNETTDNVELNFSSPNSEEDDVQRRQFYGASNLEVATLQVVSDSENEELCFGTFFTYKHIITLAKCVYRGYKPLDPTDVDPSKPPPPIIKIRYLFRESHVRGGVITYATNVCIDPDYVEHEDGSWTGRPVAVVTVETPVLPETSPLPLFETKYFSSKFKYPCLSAYSLPGKNDWPKARAVYITLLSNCSSVFTTPLINDKEGYICGFDDNKGGQSVTNFYNGTGLVCDNYILGVATQITASPYYRIFARVDNAKDFLQWCMSHDRCLLASASNRFLYLLPLIFVSFCILFC